MQRFAPGFNPDSIPGYMLGYDKDATWDEG